MLNTVFLDVHGDTFPLGDLAAWLFYRKVMWGVVRGANIHGTQGGMGR